MEPFSIQETTISSISSIMNTLVEYVSISIVTAIFLFIIYQIVENYRHLQLFKNLSIPGPKPTLFLGNMLQLEAEGRLSHETVSEWLQQYGKVFGFFIGHQAHLVINDVDLAKEITVARFNDFVDRHSTESIFGGCKDNLFDAKGQNWRDYRAILNPAFGNSKLKFYCEDINEKSNLLIKILQERVLEIDFNIVEFLEAFTLDVTASSILGLDLNSQIKSQHEMLKAFRNFSGNSFNFVLILYKVFPFIVRPLDVINRMTDFGDIILRLVNSVKELAQQRHKDPKKRQTDMLQILLEGRVASKENELTKSIRKEGIIGNGVFFLLAGYETTVATLGFALYLLALHQDVQEKIYQEIVSSLKDDDDSLAYEQIRELTYLDQTLNETMRIFTVAPLGVLRSAEKNTIIGDVFIPREVHTLIPIWHIHHNPELWPNPGKFDPDRFSEENKRNIKPGSFLPFGLGPRNCIGKRFAQLQVKIVLIKILKAFQLQPCSKTEGPLPIKMSGFVLSAKNGIFVKLTKRPEK